MTHLGSLAYARPIAAAIIQEAFDFGIQASGICRHAAILVKDSSTIKEHFPSQPLQARQVAVKDINQIVAENLKHWMKEANLSQQALADRAGVSQKTISNYLSPQQRVQGTSGKKGSPKLYELDKIAQGLGVEVWQLMRHMTPEQRVAYERIEKAYFDLQGRAETLPMSQEQEAEVIRAPLAAAKRSPRVRRGAA
jgi:transcriptional regulator with XRE-family HTH domain